MAEQEFFNEGGVVVTNSRFVVPGQTYAMSGVTSVRAGTETPSRKGPIILIVIGIPLLFAFGIGALLIIGGIIWWVLSKPDYLVVLTTSAGEQQAYVSKDSSVVQRIVAAVSEAIIARG